MLIGIPVLGPIVAWLLYDQRMARIGYQQQLEHQRTLHMAAMDKASAVYQDLALKVTQNFSGLVAENTAATRGLEKAIDTLVRRDELDRNAKRP